MGSAYVASVIKKDDNKATIRVYQTHPDYGLDADNFMDEWGKMALCCWAFSEGYAQKNFSLTQEGKKYEKLLAEGQKTALAKAAGSFDSLFDAPADEIEDALRVTKTKLVRSAYNDDNRKERLVAAGFPADQELFKNVVYKICGILEIEVEAEDDEILAPLVVGAEWEF
ncbi:MAG: hypothetical protein U0269_14495 [Polyangiales bacterium]